LELITGDSYTWLELIIGDSYTWLELITGDSYTWLDQTHVHIASKGQYVRKLL